MRCLRRFRSLAWAYKCWAACSAFCRHPAGRSRGPELGGSAPTVSKSTVFRRGFLTNISNPKSALFFGSVFAEPFLAAPGVALQVSAVAMIVVNSLCWHTLLAYFFATARAGRLCAVTQHRQPGGVCIARCAGCGAAGVRASQGAVLSALKLELGQPVSIGDDVWVGGSAITCPGVFAQMR